ncbi:MAG TPA: polysaccharide biosynthesis/export family protein [Chitinophagaceae bacterium]|nr:polysaccharide biosynthesis/export family protein [Chitinophagaceae bacterium]
MPLYLQDVKDTTGIGIKVPELRIQKYDRLSIQVYSASTKREVSDAPYNLPSLGGNGESGGAAGLLVDANGNIEYPRAGLIHAEGMTKLELAEYIRKKINENDTVLTDPAVIINFQNLKVSVLGEVKAPGPITFPNERVTILEAISMAGDLTDFGKKEEVKIIRENQGQQEIAVVDLSSKEIFTSPYYHLKQNDVVIVYPQSKKARRQDQETFFRQAGFIISIITATAVVVRLFQ